MASKEQLEQQGWTLADVSEPGIYVLQAAQQSSAVLEEAQRRQIRDAFQKYVKTNAPYPAKPAKDAEENLIYSSIMEYSDNI